MKNNGSNAESTLALDRVQREQIWAKTSHIIEDFFSKLREMPVAPKSNPVELRRFLESFQFDGPRDPLDVIDFSAQGLSKNRLNTSHPRFFGHFMPASSAMGVAADALTAAFNPQLATWRACPFATEVDQHVIKSWGQKFGYTSGSTFGHFTSGGSEANHTALLTALNSKYPTYRSQGAVSLSARPTIYTTSEAHLCHLRAASFCGLGSESVREVPVDSTLRMNLDALRLQIEIDRKGGFDPLMVVATGGTTNAGVVDPIAGIASIARKEGLWLHVDAAWGAPAVLIDEIKNNEFSGLDQADSIIMDAHKWLSVPMGAGMFLTRHPDILEKTFKFAAHFIKLDESAGFQVVDGYFQSLQWSRRFIGLKLFMTMATEGWRGYQTEIQRQIDLGKLLRELLTESDWRIENQTRLPVVCFTDAISQIGTSKNFLEAIAKRVVDSGEAWLFCTQLKKDLPALRACLVSFHTTADDIRALVNALNRARQGILSSRFT